MNLIYHNIVKWGQQTLASWAYSSGELRMRISIRTDSQASQSYAHAEMWDERGQQWHHVTSLHYAEMKTAPGVYALPDWNQESAYQDDHDELVRRASLIVRGWNPSPVPHLDQEQFDALRDQAKRALFEAEQTYPGIADRPQMQALRDLLGLGEAPPPDEPV